MTLFNLLTILGSAGIHVIAHVALKKTHNREAFVWWLLVWGCILFSPVLFFWRPFPIEVWGIMFLSAIFEALYFVAIANAYKTGDLSIVYPLARGLAPMLLLIWAITILNETPSLSGIAGVAAIAVGLYVINLPRLGAWLEPIRSLNTAGSRWALLAGLCISLYTVIDRVGIKQLDPLLYTYLALWLTLLLLTPTTLRFVGWSGLAKELRETKFASVVAGFTTLAAYAIVLYAMQNGTPASYAGAIREISVVFGVIIGVTILKERGSIMRVVGAVCVMGGVAMIALRG